MLFKKRFLESIENGSVTLAFRRWKRPTVRVGGTLLTPIGKLTIGAVSQVDLASITAAEAREAGYVTLVKLLQDLNRRDIGEFYRIELGALHPDPRIALRETRPTPEELQDLQRRLQQFDSRSSHGPWTLQTLEVVKSFPGVRAGDLCEQVGQVKDQFKRNVRKLKNLGLTVSLGTGYRVSPRGKAFLDYLGQMEK